MTQEDRAREWIENANWYPFRKLQQEDSDIVESVSAFARESVAEFIRRVLANPEVFNGPGPVMTEVYREMFGESDGDK
jgi:hypothetical protein